MAEKREPRRGGLQKRFYIIEPLLQPEAVTKKVGSEGKEVALKSNFAKFTVKPTGPFFMYDVKIPPKSLRGKLELLNSVSTTKGNDQPFCFDGRRLFTSSQWHTETIETFTINDEDISIRFLTSFIANTEEYYQMINIMFNNIQVFMGQERIGRAFFLGSNLNEATTRPSCGPSFFKRDNFKILGGFSTTLTRGTNKDSTASTLLYLERINRVLNENSVCNIYNKNQLDLLIGRDVITKYNNKTYRISDIKELNVTEEIDLNGAKISYVDYFKQRYNITLNNAKQPFVISRMRRVAIRRENTDTESEAPTESDLSLSIPGELCFLCGFSDSERSNINLQKSLGSILKREPRDRLKDISDFCTWTKGGKACTFMDKWGLELDNQPITINGRELTECEVLSNKRRINTASPDDWKFGEIKFEIPAGKRFKLGVLVVERNPAQFNQFIDDVRHEIHRLRIDCSVDSVVPCRGNEVEDCLANFFKVDKVDMALIFIGDDRLYAKIKNFTLSTGLLTQCVTIRNATNRDDRRRKVVADKSVMQMFAKLGYDPWNIQFKTMKPTIIVGMDTFHSKTGKRSVQASVFSTNSKFSQYLSFVNVSSGKSEYHDNLSRNFKTAINHFKEKFNLLPQRFIIYRDGVGDSQLYFTKKYETESVMKIIESIYGTEHLPQIIYVIVKKRISVKFFKDGNNPSPGTIVDEQIVKPNFYEFYLVSQKTTRGTATPTNYNVLMDTQITDRTTGVKEPIPPTELQKLTYSLTHLYFNWMGTIRVPVPTHYAHRLAELVGTVHRGTNPPLINEAIRHRLFYL